MKKKDEKFTKANLSIQFNNSKISRILNMIIVKNVLKIIMLYITFYDNN